MALPTGFERDLARAIGDRRIAKRVVTELNEAGADESWDGDTVTAITSVKAPAIETNGGTSDVLLNSTGSQAYVAVEGNGSTSWQLLATSGGAYTETIICTTGGFETSLSDNLADAWSITDGADDLLVFTTTNAATAMQHKANRLGFFSTTPAIQQAALTAQLTSITHTAPGTPDYAVQNLVAATGFGFVTADEGNTVLSVIANLQARLAQVETALEAYGLVIAN